jgi:uncharacterized protein (TIGR00730 family)
LFKSICVFCGAAKGKKPILEEYVRDFGKILAKGKLELIYGGASIGLMGTLANSVMSHGGKVLGVIPDFLDNKEVAHTGITKLKIVESMHERKKIMYENADAFVILPGGIGTLDEFFEIFTWKQLGLHTKPIGIYNIDGYYNDLLIMLENMNRSGFLGNHTLPLLTVDNDPHLLLQKLRNLTNTDSGIHNEDKF